MKKLCVLLLIFLGFNVSNAQNVGIGTSTPNAALEVNSTTNGFLPPRLTIAERETIIAPAIGLMIYCIDCYELQIYDGINWKNTNGAAACVSPSLPFIKICDQIWMPKNLDVINYRNGDTIPQVTDPLEWENLTTGAWCWYDNDSATYASIYGKLYNYYAINDPRGLAPEGWHLPSDLEWTTLSICLGGDAVSGGKMKETGTSHWSSPNTAADNSSGFWGLPGGIRNLNGLFGTIGNSGAFWSSTENNINDAWIRFMDFNGSDLYRSYFNKSSGFSVRCLKN